MAIAHDWLEPTETKDAHETQFIDRVLEGWGRWIRTDGIDLRPTPVGFVWRIPSILFVGHELVITDDAFVLVDQGIARLPDRLRQIVFIEYTMEDDGRAKWDWLRLKRLAYRQRLHAAQWALFSVLQSDLDIWRQIDSVRASL